MVNSIVLCGTMIIADPVKMMLLLVSSSKWAHDMEITLL